MKKIFMLVGSSFFLLTGCANNLNSKFENTINKNDTHKHHKHIDDKHIYNLAKIMLSDTKTDINVANPHTEYYGRYIGQIGSCEYASVEKKTAGSDEIYNFKQCNGNIKYTGQTLKGLTQTEY